MKTMQWPIVALLIALVSIWQQAEAGDLSPSAAPIAPTMKTLVEVEPRIAINAMNTPGDTNSAFKISQPGSYYLTGNVAGVVAKHGIEIAAEPVVIDLNGFALIGVAGSLSGVATEGLRNHLMVRNGALNSWGQHGINLADGGVGAHCILEDLVVSSNGGSGMQTSHNAIVSRCSTYGNTTAGLICFESSTLSDCTARSNGSNGIVVGAGSTLTRCAGNVNRGAGISAADGSTLTSCTAISNMNAGIAVGAGSTITHCSARRNAAAGISASSLSVIAHCATSLNSSHGIECSTGNVVSHCSSSSNRMSGINVGADSVVLSNSCYGNGNQGDGAGIRSARDGNRIEANTCTHNDIGIQVDQPGNLIIRNSTNGNAVNRSIVAGNTVGPIVTGANIATNSSPHANYDN